MLSFLSLICILVILKIISTKVNYFKTIISTLAMIQTIVKTQNVLVDHSTTHKMQVVMCMTNAFSNILMMALDMVLNKKTFTALEMDKCLLMVANTGAIQKVCISISWLTSTT